MAAAERLSIDVLFARHAELGSEPPPPLRARVRRWFEQRGARAHDTSFGLVLELDAAAARALFGAAPALAPGCALPVPPELADCELELSIAPAPAFFP